LVTAREVPPNPLISELTDHIRRRIKTVKAPDWSVFVKTGSSRERTPDDPDWWYTRAASLLRKVYLKQPTGVEELRSFYGGRADRGVAPEHRRKGGGSNLRIILQQLEAGGLVQKTARGRTLTPKGASLVDRTAAKVWEELNIIPWHKQIITLPSKKPKAKKTERKKKAKPEEPKEEKKKTKKPKEKKKAKKPEKREASKKPKEEEKAKTEKREKKKEKAKGKEGD